MNLSFAAIDFETATGYMESACALGIVTVRSEERRVGKESRSRGVRSHETKRR